jgi:alpha-beta hydrolase superfamily lysophospholipase
MPYHVERLATQDGLALHQNIWLPDGDARSALILVHGIVEHSGRYGQMAAELNRRGCAVYGLDLRGHGESGGDRVWVRRFDEYLDDVELVIERVRRRHPGRPLFLFGQSMGGTIVTLLSVARNPDVRGLVLSVPALKVSDGVYPVLRRAAKLIGRLLPRLRIIRMTGQHISRDPRVVADFRSDPLVFNDRVPTRTVAEVLRVAGWLLERLEAVEHPFLVLHGTGDRVTDPEGSRRLHGRAKSTDKTIKLYQGLYHDLLHEPEADRVTADLAEWIEIRQASPVI